jgi:prepilin-type N-terminal cleavage/methylation domain-containing protein
MMHSVRASAFTLIELLLVIAIVAVLMALLLPAVGAVQRTVMVNETRSRIAILSETINQYAMTYDGVYPPSHRVGTWNYPIVPLPSSGNEVPHFNPNHVGPNWSTNHGHSMLTYFLMGPHGFGWDVSIHNIRRPWTPPDIVRTYLTTVIVGRRATSNNPQPTDSSFAYYGFQDAWGPNGTRYNLTGCFQYCVPYARGNGYQLYDMYGAYYWGGTRGFENGDGPRPHIDRVYENMGTHRFILVSSGPDRRFGFYRWDKSLGRSIADGVNGVSDDIANVPID